jgi:hypothetical protein
MKQAAKMVNNHKVVYQINETMREELNLFAQALSASPNIKFQLQLLSLSQEHHLCLSLEIAPS